MGACRLRLGREEAAVLITPAAGLRAAAFLGPAFLAAAALVTAELVPEVLVAEVFLGEAGAGGLFRDGKDEEDEDFF